MSPEPFRVAIAQDAIDDLRARLRRTRFPRDFANEQSTYGMQRAYIEPFLNTWLQADWRETEAAINAFANYGVVLDGVPIHFIHERGKGPNPMPLILTHGWPWSFWDFREAIRPLTDPAAFGGDERDAFDVIVPSLPGFGFSSPLEVDQVSAWKTVPLWDRLMREVLGYKRYAAAGGDFGAMITMQLGQHFPDVVRGVYLTMASAPRAARPPETPPPTTLRQLLGLIDGPTSRLKREDFGPEEQHWFDNLETRWVDALAHVAVHTTDPQGIAFALHDSPAGLASWLVERRRRWSDNDGNVEQALSRQFLIDLVSIYWYTETFFTTARWYWHTFRSGPAPVADPERARTVPVGIAVSPKDLVYTPRRIIEANANLVHWTEHPRGGHFGPAEEPELFIGDVRAFFRRLR
ncbi:MAG: epoxide hydrolase family protein [Dehalococcoidia bacterium]